MWVPPLPTCTVMGTESLALSLSVSVRQSSTTTITASQSVLHEGCAINTAEPRVHGKSQVLSLCCLEVEGVQVSFAHSPLSHFPLADDHKSQHRHPPPRPIPCVAKKGFLMMAMNSSSSGCAALSLSGVGGPRRMAARSFARSVEDMVRDKADLSSNSRPGAGVENESAF